MAVAPNGQGASAQVDVSELSLDELMQVEVTTPGKVPESIAEIPASVYLIGRKDIQQFGYSSLTDILENVPGFYNVDSYTGVSGNFGVRGFWNGRSQNSSVAILMNGVPQTRMDDWSHQTETFNIPVESIDRIEVTRGPNSVIYGSGASFGAINIITDESYHDNSVTGSYGALDTSRASLRWSKFGEESHIIVNAGLYSSDGFEYELSDLMGPDNLATMAFYGVSDPNHSLEDRMEQGSDFVQVSAEWLDFGFDYSYSNSNTETFVGLPAVVDGSNRNTRNTHYTLRNQSKLNEELSLNARLTYSEFDQIQIFDVIAPGFVGFNQRDYDGLEFEALLAYLPSDELRVTAGYNWQRMSGFRELTHIPDLGFTNEVVELDDRDTFSLFAQVSYQASNVLRLVAGYRLETLEEYLRSGYTNIEVDTTPTFGGVEGGVKNGTPRVSAIYQISESQLLKVMAGDAVKISLATQNFFRPERVRTVEINYTNSLENQLFSASVFRNALSNMVLEELVFLPGGLIDTDAVVGGSVETLGLELLLKQNIGEDLRVELGATYQDSSNSNQPDEILSYSPEVVLHGKASYEGNGFMASLLARYVSEMESFYNVGSNRPGSPPAGFFGDPSDGYLVLDANIRWDDLWQGLFLSLRVNNIFDEEIRYPNNPINGVFMDRGQLGLERGVQVTAGYRF